ncbi:MAG: cytochrome c family protein [Alphaproteobacteria bacterium]|nr:cytochrome c family protein [Alphaproteobacteria bacterium]
MKTAISLAAVLLAATAGAALADGDAAKGEKVFNKCKACHVADSETNRVGPHLKGIIGRPVASVADYKYSDSMKEFATTHPTWDDATFLEYITDPKKDVPKTKMSFPGLKKEDDRNDLLAYLKTKM